MGGGGGGPGGGGPGPAGTLLQCWQASYGGPHPPRQPPLCLSSFLQIKGKYGFEFAAKWECPGMCTEGLCTWEYTCHIRVSTRRDGSYWRTPKLRCE
jgi:hypothetical protein